MRSIGAPVQVPSAAWRTAPVTRLPAGGGDVVREAEAGDLREAPVGRRHDETPFSSIVFSSAPFMRDRDDDVAERQHARAPEPRVIVYGGA